MTDAGRAIDVPRTTGTHADVFVAVGLADLLGRGTRLKEVDGRFRVEPEGNMSDEFFSQLDVSPGYPFLKPNEKVEVPPGAERPVDYKAESVRVKAFRELQGQARATPALRQDPTFQQREAALKPLDDWRQLQVLNVLQGDENSNRVHAAMSGKSQEERRPWVREGVRAVAVGRVWQPPWKAKLVQVFTPTAAKGYARLKPDSTQRGDSTKEQWVDPFVEWLKYRGYFRVACPYFVGSKGEHIRLLCPVPADITVQALSDVSAALRRAPIYGSPAKLDSLAVLTLAQLLVERWAELRPPSVEGIDDVEGVTPAALVSGVTITHYQSLGSAKAVSALTTLALPGWFTVTDQATADRWLGVLGEHRRVISALKDDHSDEIGLLLQYRRFLEKRGDLALWALLDFMSAYGPFLIRAREARRRVAAFRTDYFREIVMGLQGEYGEILDDAGFRAVAAAIRRATVSAQALKGMQKDHREIRYDLLPELRRKKTLGDGQPFLEVVADFISSYNSENARRREMRKPAPGNVTTEELARFCALMEAKPGRAKVVAALLCAYGTCRAPREPAEGGAPEDTAMDEPGPVEAGEDSTEE